MVFAKPIGTPTATKYKGKTPINQAQIQTKKIYGFNLKQTPVGKSKSPLPKTPQKSPLTNRKK